MLDERTLWAVLAVVPGLLALVTGTLGARLGEPARVLRTWTWALVLTTVVSSLYAAGWTSGPLSIAVNNLLWIPVMVLMAVAPRQLVGRSDHAGLATVVALGVFATTLALGGEGAQTSLRLSALLLFHVTCLSIGLWAVLRAPKASVSLGHVLVALGLFAALATELARFAQLWFGDALTARFMQGDASGLAVAMVSAILASFLLISVGLLLAVASRLNRQLEGLVRSDSLTGLLNRRGFEEHRASLAALGKRHGVPMALVVVDVDDFKALNARHGHGGGDQALAWLGGVLADEARSGEVVARYGGEEFLVLLPDRNAESAARWAESLRRRVEQGNADAGVPAFTISAGWAVVPGDTPFERLYRDADAALYRAKAAGKNRVAGGSAPALAFRSALPIR